MKNVIVMALVAVLSLACSGKPAVQPQLQLKAPTDLEAVQQHESLTVTLSWKAESSQHKGFSLFVRDADDLTNIVKVGEVPPTSRSFNFETLEKCKSYYLGVRAEAADPQNNSKIEYIIFYVADPAPKVVPKPVIQGEAKVYPNCLEFKYTFENLDGQKKRDWGLCWSADGIPDIRNEHAHGPVIGNDAIPITQLIPNVTLEYGREYNVRAYLTVGSETYYSDRVVTASLGNEASNIYLDWKKQSYTGLHPDIEVYACNTTLNGRPFMAWYAIADVTKGNIEFRTQIPDGLKTVDAQFTSDCQVLTNAAYFYNGRNLGFSSVRGNKAGNISAVRGSLRTGDSEYNVMYNVKSVAKRS